MYRQSVGSESVFQGRKKQDVFSGASRGSAVACSEALLRSAERVAMDGHPGLARRRIAQRNGFTASLKKGLFRFECG
jgi:hypothetical protein